MRAFQGIGGSGLFSLTLVITLQMLPAKQVPMVASYISVTQAIAAIVRPVVSGAITHNASNSDRRWIFYLNLPLGSIALVLLLPSWPRGLSNTKVFWRALKSVDYLGSALLLVAAVLLVFALQEAGSYIYAWRSGAIIASFTIAGCSFLGFVFWETSLVQNTGGQVRYVFPVHIATTRVD